MAQIWSRPIGYSVLSPGDSEKRIFHDGNSCRPAEALVLCIVSPCFTKIGRFLKKCAAGGKATYAGGFLVTKYTRTLLAGFIFHGIAGVKNRFH